MAIRSQSGRTGSTMWEAVELRAAPGRRRKSSCSRSRVQGLFLMSAAKLIDAPMWEWQFSIPIANTRPIGREIARHTAMR